MSEFRFKLTTVLQLRQSARDECRLRLAESQRADDDLRDRLARLDAERKRLHQRSRRTVAPGTVDLDRATEVERFAAMLSTEKKRLVQRREALAAEIHQRRQALLKADQDAQSLEKLRERQLSRHRLEQQRTESKQLNEYAHTAIKKRA